MGILLHCAGDLTLSSAKLLRSWAVNGLAPVWILRVFKNKSCVLFWFCGYLVQHQISGRREHTEKGTFPTYHIQFGANYVISFCFPWLGWRTLQAGHGQEQTIFRACGSTCFIWRGQHPDSYDGQSWANRPNDWVSVSFWRDKSWIWQALSWKRTSSPDLLLAIENVLQDFVHLIALMFIAFSYGLITNLAPRIGNMSILGCTRLLLSSCQCFAWRQFHLFTAIIAALGCIHVFLLQIDCDTYWTKFFS